MQIDAHVHFWKYDKQRDAWITNDMKVLRQDYLPETISGTLTRNKVDGVVAVQAGQSEFETHFLTELAKTHSLIKGVVGWVDLSSPDCAARLDYFAQYPVIKGWRHIIQDEPAGFMNKDAFLQGVGLLAQRGYTYDLLIYHHQLPEAVKFAAQFPDLRIVVDHCAKPAIRDHEFDQWKKGIEALAALPHVHCKLSGLLTEASWKSWTPGEFYPYLDTVFQAFGTDRILFGSDWPVMLLAGMYVQWKSLLEKYLEKHTEEEKEKIFGLNALQFYQLNP